MIETFISCLAALYTYRLIKISYDFLLKKGKKNGKD